MCLVCANHGESMTTEEKKDLFKWSMNKTLLCNLNGKRVQANKEQIEEIIDKALYVTATGVDMWTEVWAIQWPKGYVATTFKS